MKEVVFDIELEEYGDIGSIDAVSHRGKLTLRLWGCERPVEATLTAADARALALGVSGWLAGQEDSDE